MQQSVHGHTVINLVNDNPGKFSQEELIKTIKDEFGDAPFHTCSQEGLSIEQLLAFLISRRKLVEDAGKLFTNAARICNHD